MADTNGAPASVCLLRLSALGDCVNVVPIVHTLQHHWPHTRVGWVVNRTEAALVGGLPGVDFYVMDKKSGRAGLKRLKQQLRGTRFDVLLHMHASWRANRISRLIRARRRIGFDAARSRDGQRWFVHESVAPAAGRHVVDGFFTFLDALGLHERVLDWTLPVSAAARAQAAERLPDGCPWLLISPASSHALRNWRAERYAAVADFAVSERGMRVALIGGPGKAERALGDEISSHARVPISNLIGQSPLPLLVALLERAAVLVTPDSGPAHMGNAAGIPVVALHAATEAARSGPYTSLAWCVDRYGAAARQFHGKPAAGLPWGTKIERPGVMDLITVADVTERVGAALDARSEPERG